MVWILINTYFVSCFFHLDFICTISVILGRSLSKHLVNIWCIIVSDLPVNCRRWRVKTRNSWLRLSGWKRKRRSFGYEGVNIWSDLSLFFRHQNAEWHFNSCCEEVLTYIFLFSTVAHKLIMVNWCIENDKYKFEILKIKYMVWYSCSNALLVTMCWVLMVDFTLWNVLWEITDVKEVYTTVRDPN